VKTFFTFVVMKFRLLYLLFGVLLWVGCKEENPGILFTDPIQPLKDTTYVISPAPSSVYKKVLLEDLTGVRCVNCPQAAEKAAELKLKFKDSLVVIGLYLKAMPQFTFPWTDVDLRTDDAEVIASAVGTPSSLPAGFVDRVKFGNQASLLINQWEPYIQQRRGISPVTISLSYENVDLNELVFYTKLTYTQDRSNAQHKLALYITENNILGKQSSIGGSIEDYLHQHVLRGSVTLPLGNILNAPLVAGRVFEQDIPFTWNTKWDQNNAYLVAVVINAQDESVVQVEEIKLY
jgi:hypothetical protein